MYYYNTEKMINFVENVLIPDILDYKERGYKRYIFTCGYGVNPLAVIAEVEKRIDCKGDAMSATAYFYL